MNQKHEAIANADVLLRNVGLPTYTDLISELVTDGNKVALNAFAAALVTDVVHARGFDQGTGQCAPPTAANHYQGHGTNTGGLQRHSIGDTYPLTVIGQTIDGRLFYAAFDTRDNSRGAYRLSYNAAAQDIENGAIYDVQH